MYWGGTYWGPVYWPPAYWGTGVLSIDCAGGPYVEHGYWECGYAVCDCLGQKVALEGGGGIDRKLDWSRYRLTPAAPLRKRGDRRFTEQEDDEWFAQLAAWEAINKARRDADEQEYEARQVAPSAPVVAEVAAPSTVTMTEMQLRVAVQTELNEDRRKAMLALLLILNEA